MSTQKVISGLPATALEDYLELGRTVEYLLRTMHPNAPSTSESLPLLASNHPQNCYSMSQIKTTIEALLSRLEEHDFDNSLATAALLSEVVDLIDGHLAGRPLDRSGKPKEEWVNRLIGYVRSVDKTMKAEATSRLMIQLDLTAVTDPISLLPTKLKSTDLEMQDWQEALWQDVVKCLQTRAYRPAIIIGWALCYDIIRYWIFRDSQRLSDFNNELTRRQNITISNYEEFFLLKESVVLDYCRLGGGALAGFTDKTQRSLQVLLDERNEFAHANYRQASAAVAQAHIERLIAIICDAPFLMP